MKYTLLLFFVSFLWATNYPPDFSEEIYVEGLDSPDCMAFAPDGRLFIAERISGAIRVVDAEGNLLPEPFLTLPVPPDRHRSAGLRGISFHPQFPDTPYVYVFYMQNTPRFNRLSRFTADSDNPNQAIPNSEDVLMDFPVNSTGATGSHNGGALGFGGDGKLYVTTGDGWQNWEDWNQGDPVQSLETYTGKVFRLNDDGSIPTDNPFYSETEGPLRSIYALGFRNPFTLAKHPESGNIYVSDVEGPKKDAVKHVTAGSNFKYEQFGSWNEDLGTGHDPWISAGGRVVSGGTWVDNRAYPAEYAGSYFACSWLDRVITRVPSGTDVAIPFADNVSSIGGGPVYLIQNPVDGHLYWLSTDYETESGAVVKIVYEGEQAPISQTAKNRLPFIIRQRGSKFILEGLLPGGVLSFNLVTLDGEKVYQSKMEAGTAIDLKQIGLAVAPYFLTIQSADGMQRYRLIGLY